MECSSTPAACWSQLYITHIPYSETYWGNRKRVCIAIFPTTWICLRWKMLKYLHRNDCFWRGRMQQNRRYGEHAKVASYRSMLLKGVHTWFEHENPTSSTRYVWIQTLFRSRIGYLKMPDFKSPILCSQWKYSHIFFTDIGYHPTSDHHSNWHFCPMHRLGSIDAQWNVVRLHFFVCSSVLFRCSTKKKYSNDAFN